MLREAPAMVIVDESHHLRNPRTRRYAAAATLCDRAHVLLLSATPVQNRRADLMAQLALFLGDAACAMSDIELAGFIVRHDRGDSNLSLPAVIGPEWISLDVEDDILEELMNLPSPLALADEGDAHTLLRYTLLRQWSSSRAALVAGLRARLARGLALTAALEAGRCPSRHELATWFHSDDALQLALPELLLPLGADASETRDMLVLARDHVTALRAVLARLRRTADPDPARAEALRKLRRRHAGARLIAFSQYAQTVRALSSLLMPREAGVAELTARGGRVAGGRVARGDVLAQYSPASSLVPAAERIDLLVTTDVSSEGLDLQRASVVIHLDLPWNPARLEQRVGRVRRLGSHHARVFVYVLAPPASSERVLEVETRLRSKLRIAAHLIGVGSACLPEMQAASEVAAPALTTGLHRMIEQWRAPVASPEEELPIVAAVAGDGSGWVALIADGEQRLLVGEDGQHPTLDPRVLFRLVSQLDGRPTEPRSEELGRALGSIARWWQRRVAREEMRVLSPDGARVRARAASRIAHVVTSAPRHLRASLAAGAAEARRTLRVPLGVGAERQLAALADAPVVDGAWLSRVAALGAGRAVGDPNRPVMVQALILITGPLS
jgi:hypothetical protein